MRSPRWLSPTLSIALVIALLAVLWAHQRAQRALGVADAYAAELVRAEAYSASLEAERAAAERRNEMMARRLDSLTQIAVPAIRESEARGERLVTRIVEVVPDSLVEMRAELEAAVAAREAEIERERKLREQLLTATEEQLAAVQEELRLTRDVNAGLREQIRLQSGEIEALRRATGTGWLERLRIGAVGAAIGAAGWELAR